MRLSLKKVRLPQKSMGPITLWSGTATGTKLTLSSWTSLSPLVLSSPVKTKTEWRLLRSLASVSSLAHNSTPNSSQDRADRLPHSTGLLQQCANTGRREKDNNACTYITTSLKL